MPLENLLQALHARQRFGIRPGVERVGELLARLGNPERSFRTIHVAGTNGKGSTTAFLASILNMAGHRTARFISPHLIHFTERFWIDGMEAEPERLAALLDRVLALAPPEATFFEIITALAALFFAEERVELAVMEAGMGGRSDATAVMPGIMTIITPIALDHCDYLGGTLELIATEKAAIAEPGTPVISARQPHQVTAIIRRYAGCGSSPLCLAGEDFSARWLSPGNLEYRGLAGDVFRFAPGIPGRYQAENAALALAAAEMATQLNITVPRTALEAGLAGTRWPGRMELVAGNPPLLLDGAHNRAGADALADALNDYRFQHLHLVVGIMGDKDASDLLTPLVSRASCCYCVTPAIERALSAPQLAEIIRTKGLPARICGSVTDGIATAQHKAGAHDLILVTGSLFTVGEAKAWLTGAKFEGIRG